MIQPVCRDAATETYHDVEKWISTIVGDFRRRYPTEESYHDMMQEASLAFMHALNTWDADRSAFTYYLQLKVFSKLFSKYRTGVTRSQALPRVRIEDLDAVECSNRTFDRGSFLTDLGDDARALAEVVMDGLMRNRDDLQEHAASMGWDNERFDLAFMEVKEAIL